jgi:hypothetical protein
MLLGGAEVIRGAKAAGEGAAEAARKVREWLSGAPQGPEPAGMSLDELELEAQSRGVTRDELLLARMAFSEAGNYREARAVMHTALNRIERGSAPDLTRAILGRETTLGPQGHGSTRPYATSRNPDEGQTLRYLDLAARVLEERQQGVDPTEGATNFMHPLTQQAAHERDPRHNMPPEQVDASWQAGGLERVDVPGTDADRIWMYRPRRRRR